VNHDLGTDDEEHVCQAKVHGCGAVCILKRKLPAAKPDPSRAVSLTYRSARAIMLRALTNVVCPVTNPMNSTTAELDPARFRAYCASASVPTAIICTRWTRMLYTYAGMSFVHLATACHLTSVQTRSSVRRVVRS
jgi:hypothetical protein